ncbi:MAG TPA: rhodanese-like domain-containing protein [Deferrisomatales bacterium]|nr:rhodanese-like domain-containing protein [Deferrisomatales bacterium]
MGFIDLLRRVKTRSAEESRRWIAQQGAHTYTLLDVREPAEYEDGHLPGALLMPLSQLPDRWRELDPALPVLVY